jgi:LysM repeat protein
VKKNISFIVMMWAVLFAASCKSTPPVEPDSGPQSEPKLESNTHTQFINAYEAVLPIVYEGAQNYTVKPGDALTRIARNFYGRGNAFFFPLIMAASKDRQTVNIVDPDLIEPGMELVIPKLEPNFANPEIKARIKVLLENVSEIYKDKPDTNWSLEIYNGLVTTAESL